MVDKNSRKTYHSPKFDLNEINKQIQKGNQIIGSIIKEEDSILPNLLKNYIITYTDIKDGVVGCDLVVEAATENVTLKMNIFRFLLEAL